MPLKIVLGHACGANLIGLEVKRISWLDSFLLAAAFVPWYLTLPMLDLPSLVDGRTGRRGYCFEGGRVGLVWVDT